MARARNIKPGFFTNGDLLECQPLARLLFAGLWCEADRRGILEDRPKTLKVKILPGDNCDVNELLDELSEHGFITRYEVDGVHCIFIRNFEKHQNAHYKEVPTDLPAPPEYVPVVMGFGVTEQRRQAIFDRDGRRCTICGDTEHLSLDHVIPRSRGGTDEDENLTTLCGRCNASKNNRLSSAQRQVNIDSTSGQCRSDVDSTSPDDSTINRADSLLPLTDSLLLNAELTPQPPKGDRKTPRIPKINLDGFREFYDLYPKHVKPATAEQAWSKLDPDERRAAIDAIRRQRSWPHMNGDQTFIPNPSTWLRARSWEDEPPKFMNGGAINGHVPRRTGGAAAGGMTPQELDAYAAELERLGQ